MDTVPLADALALVPPGADLALADDASSGDEGAPPAGGGRYLCSCFVFLRAGRPHNLWLMARWRALQALSGSNKNQARAGGLPARIGDGLVWSTA